MHRKMAGHEFSDDNIDSCCTRPKNGVEFCIATRSFLFQATEEDVGKTGYAHSLHLSQGEYNEIVHARTDYEVHCEKVMTAIRMVSG